METKYSNEIWLHYYSVLDELYKKMAITKLTEMDRHYFKHSIMQTELRWGKAFAQMSEIRFVLLGEAPLFGEKESYFYNPASGATSFFTYKDAEVVCGEVSGSNKLSGGVRERKLNLISGLTNAGFLILDVYPFCFAPPLTAISYRQIEKKNHLLWLFKNTYLSWLKPKLNKIYALNPSVHFGFRYKNTFDNIGQCLDQELNQLGFLNDTTKSYHLGRNLNRNKLRDVLNGSIA